MATDTSEVAGGEDSEHSTHQCFSHERHSSNRSIDSCESSSSSDSNDGSSSSIECSDSTSNSGSSSTASDSDSSHENVDDERVTEKKKASKKKTVIQNQTKSKKAKNPYCCSTAGRCVRSCAAYGRVCPLLADAAGRAAAEHISKICEGSVLFQDCCCCNSNCSSDNGAVLPSTIPRKKNKKKQKENKKNAVEMVSQEKDPTDTSESTVCGSASATSFCSFSNSNHSTDHENSNSPFSCFSNVRIIEPSDIVMGEKLGEGGFCNVYSCALKKQKETSTSTKNNCAKENDEDGVVSTDLASILTDETCAVKFLRREVTAHRKTFQVRNPGRQFYQLLIFPSRLFEHRYSHLFHFVAFGLPLSILFFLYLSTVRLILLPRLSSWHD